MLGGGTGPSVCVARQDFPNRYLTGMSTATDHLPSPRIDRIWKWCFVTAEGNAAGPTRGRRDDAATSA